MNPQNPGMGLGPHAGLGAVVNENWSVPDKMVGLSEYCIKCPVLPCRNYMRLYFFVSWYTLISNIYIALFSVIGKGGEQIASIQAETGCKIQFAQGAWENFIKICNKNFF